MDPVGEKLEVREALELRTTRLDKGAARGLCYMKRYTNREHVIEYTQAEK